MQVTWQGGVGCCGELRTCQISSGCTTRTSGAGRAFISKSIELTVAYLDMSYIYHDGHGDHGVQDRFNHQAIPMGLLSMRTLSKHLHCPISSRLRGSTEPGLGSCVSASQRRSLLFRIRDAAGAPARPILAEAAIGTGSIITSTRVASGVGTAEPRRPRRVRRTRARRPRRPRTGLRRARRPRRTRESSAGHGSPAEPTSTPPSTGGALAGGVAVSAANAAGSTNSPQEDDMGTQDDASNEISDRVTTATGISPVTADAAGAGRAPAGDGEVGMTSPPEGQGDGEGGRGGACTGEGGGGARACGDKAGAAVPAGGAHLAEEGAAQDDAAGDSTADSSGTEQPGAAAAGGGREEVAAAPPEGGGGPNTGGAGDAGAAESVAGGGVGDGAAGFRGFSIDVPAGPARTAGGNVSDSIANTPGRGNTRLAGGGADADRPPTDSLDGGRTGGGGGAGNLPIAGGGAPGSAPLASHSNCLPCRRPLRATCDGSCSKL